MSYITTNNAFSTLAGSISATELAIAVGAGHGDRFPVIVAPDYSYITFENAAGNIEIVKLTARAAASDVLTIERAQDNTIARAWASGDVVELRIIALLLNTAIAHASSNANAHTANAITFTPVATIVETNVQAAITGLESKAYTAINAVTANVAVVNTNLTAHVASPSAHAAANITNIPSGNVTQTNVQSAINQLDSLQTSLKVNQVQYAVTTGTSADYLAALPIPITSYVDDQVFKIKFNQACVDNATIKISGINPPLDLKIATSKGVLVNVASGDIIANHVTLGLVVNGGTGLLIEAAVNAISRIGSIEKFPFDTPPFGYLSCPLVATAISRITYSDLYAVLGTKFGAGDGTTTFGIPVFPADYTDVQANSNVGSSTIGAVIAHTHLQTLSSGTAGISGVQAANINGIISASTIATQSTGGAANLAAGVRLLFCIRYRD